MQQPGIPPAAALLLAHSLLQEARLKLDTPSTRGPPFLIVGGVPHGLGGRIMSCLMLPRGWHGACWIRTGLLCWSLWEHGGHVVWSCGVIMGACELVSSAGTVVGVLPVGRSFRCVPQCCSLPTDGVDAAACWHPADCTPGWSDQSAAPASEDQCP